MFGSNDDDGKTDNGKFARPVKLLLVAVWRIGKTWLTRSLCSRTVAYLYTTHIASSGLFLSVHLCVHYQNIVRSLEIH